jgi:hypothetical protein
MLRRTLLTALAALVLVANANAATVTLHMMKDTAGAGTWQLLAEATDGDNGGIASFNVPLLDIATLTNESPFYQLNATNFQPAGFSELRVPATDANTVNKEVFASQRLVPTPTPNLQFGYGQTAGEWPASAFVAAAPSRNPIWQDRLLLASGTYAQGTDPRVNGTAAALSILVFDNTTGPEAVAADVVLGGGGGDPVMATDANLGDVANAIINHQFAATGGTPPLTWSNLTLVAGSPAPAVAPTLSSTGAFLCHTFGSQRPGTYSWNATVTDTANPATSDLATLTLNLIVPEPATMSLIGIAMVGLVGFARRRS